MEWWKDLSDEQIEQLKVNKTALGLLSYSQQNIFEKIGKDDLLIWVGYQWKFNHQTDLNRDLTFCLRPDWQQPEPEKKQGHWEEYGIYSKEYRSLPACYLFNRDASNWSLDKAFLMVGFGGIEYEKFPNQWFTSLMLTLGKTILRIGESGGLEKPAVPKKVRFWVEG